MDPLQSWREEQNSAYLYRVLAQLESGARGRLFVNLAEAALDQAHTWAELARQQGLPLPAHYRPPLRTRLVAQLLRRVGPRRMLQVLAAMKVRGLSVYTRPPAHPHPVSAEEPEKRHAALTSGGNLRAAVFGVNDGLLSNASLILGMAGAAVDNRVILLTGLAGMLAGAFSMAAGEYVSMRSQREMFEFQIRLEREELAAYPQEEAEELALIYQARGLPAADAERMAQALVADPQHALDSLAREELGLDPNGLGSPWSAAGSSFLAFAAGAVLPLLPFLLGAHAHALAATVALTLGALCAVGAATSLFTGRSALRSGLRMMFIGVLAGTATYGVGHLFGVSVT
ncbi:MAG: VIT1/CCC1 transporter family protein [Pseudomonadota bacterium]